MQKRPPGAAPAAPWPPAVYRWAAVIGATLALFACAAPDGPSVGPDTGASTKTAEAIPTPTVTPEPLAARVNGEGILLEAFLREVARFEAAQQELGTELATLGDYRLQVLWALIDRQLLAQGAQAQGLVPESGQVDERLDSIVSERGGEEAMGAWLAANGYTVEEFTDQLGEEIMAATMVQWIVDQLPEAVDQVHARHILVSSEAEAQDLREQILAGADFEELARISSLDLNTRLSGGDLGWFPRNHLTTPAVEEAAFGLQPGELSGIVQSDLGYHLVQLLERESRPVYGEARTRYRETAVNAWLDAARLAADIEIYLASQP